MEHAMSATTLLLINAICSFIGAGVGAWLGARSWYKKQEQKEPADNF
jgi:hypothetical protein